LQVEANIHDERMAWMVNSKKLLASFLNTADIANDRIQIADTIKFN